MMNYGAYFVDAVAAELQEASEPEARIVIRVFRMQDVIKLLPLPKRYYSGQVSIGSRLYMFHGNSPGSF
jgi:hypothetical protein